MQREDHALGAQLSYEPTATRAERDANRQLALARRRAREEQAREIHRGDESTNPTAPRSTNRLARTLPTIDSRSGATEAAAEGPVVLVLGGESARDARSSPRSPGRR